MDERFEHHLASPHRFGAELPGAHSGRAGGALCGDEVELRVAVQGGVVAGVACAASGCGAAVAAASAAAFLVEGRGVLDAARVGAREVAGELGGLSAGKLHAAELAADALHRALGAAVAADGRLVPDPARTLVAMSGGVDSAAAALLVQRAGREAVAVTLELWRDPENDGEGSCCSADAVRLARSVAHRMGMPHLTLDLRAEFRAGVVEPYLQGHAAGETPNPCVRCNGHVRIDAMLDLAERLGAADLATGHYARVESDAQGALLRLGADPAKDQAYALAALDPASVAQLRLPLGAMHKGQVRELAAAAGLPVAGKPDSQDLCFLAGTGRTRFLERHGAIRSRPGAIVDVHGVPVGRHRGAHEFTIGQRRGLGVGGGEPLYVIAKDQATNTVVAGPRHRLQASAVTLRGARLHRDGALVDAVKVRYRGAPIPATVTAPAGRHRSLEVSLLEPTDRPAPGQAAVLLSGELVVGYGWVS